MQMYRLIVLFTFHRSHAELVSFALQAEVNCVCYHPSFDALARKNSFNLDFFVKVVCLNNFKTIFVWKDKLSAWSPGTSENTCLPYECLEGQAIPVKFKPEASKTYFCQPSANCSLFRMS